MLTDWLQTDVKTIVSEALKKATYTTPITNITDSEGNEEPVNVGDPCRNNGCKTVSKSHIFCRVSWKWSGRFCGYLDLRRRGNE